MTLPLDLCKARDEIRGYAEGYGLDFFKVIFEVLDWKQINEVAALGGFPNRYPHWRFGMEYEDLSKRYAYGLSKIYEMVINNDPCYAYLLHCNNMVDQKLVMAHVYAHCDFFKNNIYFAHTNRKMMDEMANHRTRIIRYINRYGHDKVEDFIDACLSIDNLIDLHAAAIKRTREVIPNGLDKDVPVVKKMRSKPYMDKYINPPDFLKDQEEKIKTALDKEKNFPESPERDVMGFLLDFAPVESWERDILSMIREEAYYFAPQGQTKIMNEGWACVTGDTLVHTEFGWLKAKSIAENKLNIKVDDGETKRNIYDWAIFPSRDIVKIRTKRGIQISGSTTHRVMLSDETWKRLDSITVGDQVKLFASDNLWPENELPISWEPNRRCTLQDVADNIGVNISTVIRHKTGQFVSRRASEIDEGLKLYEQVKSSEGLICKNRKEIKVPDSLNDDLALFLGYLTGDGHISRIKRVLGLTTGDLEQAERFAELGESLFGLVPRIRKDEERYRVLFHSEDLSDFLELIGLKTGFCAREKEVPESILKSPKSVVASFIRAYFDCDAYAGKDGIKLSTSSSELCDKIQLLLLNFGILSTKIRQPSEIWHLCIFGESAKKFFEDVGFGLKRKQIALKSYLDNHQWFKTEKFEDKVVDIEYGVEDVYDFSVEESHRYVAAGLINHNSYWHSKIMTQKALHPSEIIDYADHHSGTLATSPGRLNPYKIGIELFKNIEERWNTGRFGKEFNECTNMVEKKNWNQNLGLGREKMFEIRKIYNDIMFIDEFLTPEFCKENKLFVYSYNLSSDQFEVADRAFASIKEKLLFQLTNMGSPIIDVVDANYGNKTELLLKHRHEGVDLRIDYAKEVLKSLNTIWKRTVNIETVFAGSPKIISFDGSEYKEFRP